MTQNDINNRASIMAIDNITIDGNTISSTDTNGNVIIAPDGSGVVSVTTAPIVPTGDRADSLGSATNSWDNVYADGVTFDDGTNILSAYTDKTSWTPVLSFGGGSTGITYSSQTGDYVRIGSLVFVAFSIVLTSKGSSSGDVSIAGLPFAPSAAFTLASRWGFINLTAAQTAVLFFAAGGGTTIQTRISGDNITGSDKVTDAITANNATMAATGVYHTAA